MDLHPVSVTLARVTYLLAIGRSRLTAAGEATSRFLYILATLFNGESKALIFGLREIWSFAPMIPGHLSRTLPFRMRSLMILRHSTNSLMNWPTALLEGGRGHRHHP